MQRRKPPPTPSPKEHPVSTGRHQPLTTNNGRDQLVDNLTQLTLVSPASSRRPSFARGPSLSHDTIDENPSSRHDLLPRRSPAPRRTPSICSLREDSRRASSPSLTKRKSATSLRSNGGTSRRTSLNVVSNSVNMLRPNSPSVMSECPSPPPLPTASSIAADHFAKEVALHQSTNLRAKTVVVLQDLCYGHRYSRPRTSKIGLESIVERPERLHAGILGLAAAYIRMGKRWGNNRFAPRPDLDLKSLPTPPFQIHKTTRTLPLNSPAVTHVHGVKWMGELKTMCDAAESRLASNGKELVRPNSSASDGSNAAMKLHEGDLYLCSESLNAFEGALGGVCEAVDAVFSSDVTRRAFVCIRPPGHHCSSDYPSGFCWLNNVHVGIAHAAMTHNLTHAAIIDFDLHHGDGSQTITWEQNRKANSSPKSAPLHKKTKIGYFSLHDIKSYPCEDGDMEKVVNASVCIDNAHGQSIWNVHLESWKDHTEFWQLYNTKYSILLEKTRAFLREQSQQISTSSTNPPKAAIFISAGFDASEWESAGMQRHQVNVPTDFYARFTSDIVRLSEEAGLAVDGRIISVLEGGYSDRALASGVLSHLAALSETHQAPEDPNTDILLAAEMASKLNLNAESSGLSKHDGSEKLTTFDSIWWSQPMLEELEALAHRPPPQPVRKTSQKGLPSFLAHTQSSAAKAVNPIKERGAAFHHQDDMDEVFSLPEVDWALATVELSKAVIPTDRQTLSWKHADLKLEGARAKKERHSLTGSTDLESVSERGHMQLRERKAKPSAFQDTLPVIKTRSSSRNTRRTTIASSGDLPDPVLSETPIESIEENQGAATQIIPESGWNVSNGDLPVNNLAKSTAALSLHDPSSRPVSRAQSVVSAPGASAPIDAQKQRALTSARLAMANERPRIKKSSSPEANSEPSNFSQNPNFSAVRKIHLKLKVPTPEEHAAREAARIAAERHKGPNKPQKTPARSTKQSTNKQTVKAPRAMAPPAPPPQPVPVVQTPDPCAVPLPAESNSVSAVEPLAQKDLKTPDNESVHDNPPLFASPLTPQSPPTETHVLAKSAPPTTYKKENLPIFTSTSVIPFGPPPENNSGP